MAKRRTKPEKAVTESVLSTTVGVIPAGQPIQPAYSRANAVRQYASWVYAAARGNAVGMASVPLRLYAPGRSAEKRYGERLYTSRSVPRDRAKYLAGNGRTTPHRRTVAKMIELGEDYEEVVSHPALDLLSSVNPWSAGYELIVKLALHLQLCGDAFWFLSLEGVGGVPDMIVPLLPKMVEIIPSKTSYISGYLYGGRSLEPVPLTPDEVIHFRMPNPDDNFYGKGWVEAAWGVISQNAAVHEMDTAFFANYARPDYLIAIENSNGDGKDAIKRFSDQVKAQNQGVKKTGKALAVTGKVDIRPLSFPPKDLGGRDQIVEEIAAISGYPVSMLKANDPNLASAEAGYAMWREATILPMCKLVEDVLNQVYLRAWGLEGQAVFAFDDPVPKNVERASVILDREVKAGLKSINDGRSEIGEEPSDDPMADRLLFNGQPLGSAAMVAQPTSGQTGTSATPSTPEPVSTPESQNSTQIASDAGAAVQDTALNGAQVSSLIELVAKVTAKEMPVESAIAVASAAFPLMTPEQVSAIFNPLRRFEAPTPEPVAAPVPAKPPEQVAKSCGCGTLQSKAWVGAVKEDFLPLDDTSERRIRQFAKGIDEVLGLETKAIVDAMRSAGAGQAAIDAALRVASDPDWVQAIREAATPHYVETLFDGAQAGLSKLPVSIGVPQPVFEVTNPEVQKAVDRAVTRLSVGVNRTTTVNVRDLLGDGLQQGETIDQLSERVTAATGASGQRAEMIARTESAKAYESGQIEAWKQAGVERKKWLLAPDACEFCRAVSRASNDAPVPIGQPFVPKGTTVTGVSGGSFLADYEDVQGPPLHPSCRCSLVPE